MSTATQKVLKILRYVQHASASAHSTLLSPCCEKLLAVYYFNRYNSSIYNSNNNGLHNSYLCIFCCFFCLHLHDSAFFSM